MRLVSCISRYSLPPYVLCVTFFCFDQLSRRTIGYTSQVVDKCIVWNYLTVVKESLICVKLDSL